MLFIRAEKKLYIIIIVIINIIMYSYDLRRVVYFRGKYFFYNYKSHFPNFAENFIEWILASLLNYQLPVQIWTAALKLKIQKGFESVIQIWTSDRQFKDPINSLNLVLDGIPEKVFVLDEHWALLSLTSALSNIRRKENVWLI